MQETLEYYTTLLTQGEIIAIPTETVYGLAADATNASAVEKIFLLKQRPNFNPLIAHVSNLEMALKFGSFSPLALRLARHFWPGSLTLIVPHGKHKCAPQVTAGLDTIGLRVPAHPKTLALINMFGRPVAAPSANISGTISPTKANHVKISFGNNTPPIIDGGACTVGLESTILSVIDDNVTLLRQGGIAASEIETFLQKPLQIQTKADENGKISSPGQLLRHYAPKKPIYINQITCADNASYIAFGIDALPQNTPYIFQLSTNKDLKEAASSLFSALYHADQEPTDMIYIAPIPNIDLGISINDRINRAKNK